MGSSIVLDLDFQCMGENSENIIQNIFICVSEKKKSSTGLERNKGK